MTPIKIVFKDNSTVTYQFVGPELDKLRDAFLKGEPRATCDAANEQGQPCRLFLIFSEIQYIG